jgi:hypothetical protein
MKRDMEGLSWALAAASIPLHVSRKPGHPLALPYPCPHLNRLK